MTRTFSFVEGIHGECEVSYGRAKIRIDPEGPLEVKTIQAGRALIQPSLRGERLSCNPKLETVPTWLLMPQLTAPKVVLPGGDEQDGIRVVEFEVEGVEPVSGLLTMDLEGAVDVTAARINLQHHPDIWVFIMTSPATPFKIEFQKPRLSVSHGNREATADLGVSLNGELVAAVNAGGAGFLRVSVAIRRRFSRLQFEEQVGEVDGGSPTVETLSWTPTSLGWDALMICGADLSVNEFLSFLGSNGVPLTDDGFALSTDTVFGDGPNVEYTLRLTGERRFLGDLHDETEVSATW